MAISPAVRGHTAAPRKSRKGIVPPPPVEAAVEPPLSRLDRLRQMLLPTVDCLQRRRADLIEEALIDDYVDLNWMEWQGGSLKLTVTGQNICVQMRREQPVIRPD